MNELRRTELIKLVNETIDATNDVPVIDAPSVAKAALERMPPDEPRPDWLGVELEEIADVFCTSVSIRYSGCATTKREQVRQSLSINISQFSRRSEATISTIRPSKTFADG